MAEFRPVKIDHVNCSKPLHEPSKFHIGCSPEFVTLVVHRSLSKKTNSGPGAAPLSTGTLPNEIKSPPRCDRLSMRKWLNLRTFRTAGSTRRTKRHSPGAAICRPSVPFKEPRNPRKCLWKWVFLSHIHFCLKVAFWMLSNGQHPSCKQFCSFRRIHPGG
jgi:hypothetical protein